MKCLQCGHCCSFPVVIIHPDHKDSFDGESGDWDPGEGQVMFKDEKKVCPYFSWDGDKAICAIHDKWWFSKTPCGCHAQLERSIKDDCRAGSWMKYNNIDIREVYDKGEF